MHECTNTHTHAHPQWASDHYKAIPPDRNPLNSLWFLGFMISPFCLLSPQQPPTAAAAKNNTGAPLKPAPHHSTAWPQERDQNTHKKGNTSYCGRRGKRAFIRPHAWRYLLMILETEEPHTLMHQAKARKRKVHMCASMCEYILHVVWLRRWHSFLISFCQWFNHKLNKNTYIINL